jgi:hypothetical protein
MMPLVFLSFLAFMTCATRVSKSVRRADGTTVFLLSRNLGLMPPMWLGCIVRTVSTKPILTVIRLRALARPLQLTLTSIPTPTLDPAPEP